MANAAQTGRPGRASAAVPAANVSVRPLFRARGGSRSAAASSVLAPISWGRGAARSPPDERGQRGAERGQRGEQGGAGPVVDQRGQSQAADRLGGDLGR